MAGCFKEDEPKAIIAEKDLQTFATPEGSESFIIQKGEVCTAGKKKIEKQYQYMEVVCPGKGHAWVITGDPYRYMQ
ncbi:hypothetical Protein YC6258_03421 [Gynuella sunshinyii YC6258]|uniref:Uncharacterized protein n=1 Tax=Gynuella sunshinyii YC6258 TaxID=1445510 RepID=A0A0C5VL78_9GAMM|nr:hypothetical Protein YC6258_03421 [Gynuella sunshinyii YC6258]